MTISSMQQFIDAIANTEILQIWDVRSSQPTWHWSLVLGGLVGAVIASLLAQTNVIFKIPAFIYKYFFKKSAIIGNWKVYHWSYLGGKPIIIKSNAKIVRGFIRAYIVTLHQDVTSKLGYKGHIDIEKDQLIFSLNSVDHHENLIVRMRNPLGKASDKMAAIWLGHDHEGDVAAGGLLLSRQELTDTDIAKELSGRITNQSKTSLMTVKRL